MDEIRVGVFPLATDSANLLVKVEGSICTLVYDGVSNIRPVDAKCAGDRCRQDRGFTGIPEREIVTFGVTYRTQLTMVNSAPHLPAESVHLKRVHEKYDDPFLGLESTLKCGNETNGRLED